MRVLGILVFLMQSRCVIFSCLPGTSEFSKLAQKNLLRAVTMMLFMCKKPSLGFRKEDASGPEPRAAWRKQANDSS